MTQQEMKERTKEFAKGILALVDALPHCVSARVIANQLGRSGTSVAANYRAACRARSKAEFIARLGVVLEEPDESELWLELLAEGRLVDLRCVQPLLNEASELVRIIASSLSTAKQKQASPASPPPKRIPRSASSPLDPAAIPTFDTTRSSSLESQIPNLRFCARLAARSLPLPPSSSTTHSLQI